MHQADYLCHRPTPWMQESVSMHKIPNPVAHESIKFGGRGKRDKKRWKETGKTEARRLMERKTAQQNKNPFEELKKKPT